MRRSREAGLAPGNVELEVTENTVMAQSDRALIVLSGLRELGVSLSIDDFGTGYSSLTQPAAAAVRRAEDRPVVRLAGPHLRP